MTAKLSKWIGYLLMFGFISVALVFYFLVPKLMVEIRSPESQVIKEKSDRNYDLIQNRTTGTPITFYSKDSLKLSAYLVQTQSDSVKGTIILVHGIRGRKEHFIGLSDLLAQSGYNSVLFDLRAHGQSEGRYCTFGVKEKEDLSLLIDELIVIKRNSSIPIGLIGVWGQSLGGAVALQAMSIDTRLKFGVIESTFSDFESIAHDYLNYFIGYSFKSMSRFMVYRGGKLAKFKTELASPIMACKSIHQPVFMTHGDEDKKINIKYARANFKALASKQKKFVVMEGASHVGVWKTGGKAYFDMVLDFIDTQVEFNLLN